MTALWRILRLWQAEAGFLLAGAAVSLLAVASLAGLAAVTGEVATPMLLGAGVALAWALRVLGMSRVILRYLERLLTHSATFRALTRLRVWMFRGLAARSGGGLGFLRSGDALARLVDDVEALDGLYIRIAIPALSILVLVPALVLACRDAGPALALPVAALFLAASLLLPLLAMRAAAASGTALAPATAGLRVAVLDLLGGLREARAFGAEGRMLAAVQAREAALFGAQRRLARHGAVVQGAAFLCAQAALLLVLMAAGLPATALFPAILIVLVAFELVGGMPRAGVLAGLAATAAGRIVAAADGPSGIVDPAEPLPIPPGTGLRFEAVGFAWPSRGPVLDRLTLEIPAGAHVAILGPSGSGKSTLAALALKVVQPQSGRVLLDGIDLARLRAADVQARIAWLGQGTTLFADTVRANLLLGRPGSSDADLWQALEAAAVADTVRALPQGLDTWLGPGGEGLSGGQSRRVALARALLSTAPILILDEPASGLDAAAEQAFLSTLNDAAPGRTVVMIVHRLTGVERLDRIWRLSGGRAVAAAG